MAEKEPTNNSESEVDVVTVSTKGKFGQRQIARVRPGRVLPDGSIEPGVLVDVQTEVKENGR